MINNEKDLSDKSVSQSREIKFRAFVKGQHFRGFIYGYYVYSNRSDTHQIIDENSLIYYISRDTLGQYTGLKDKNGVDIYELDYVDYKGKTYKVFYNKYKISLANISGKDIIDLTDDILSDLFIIGNLYENRH